MLDWLVTFRVKDQLSRRYPPVRMRIPRPCLRLDGTYPHMLSDVIRDSNGWTIGINIWQRKGKITDATRKRPLLETL